MQEVNYMDIMGEVTEKLSHRGVFLNVAGETPNTMTIGWGWIGHCWNKPVFVAVVRPQRHTYDLLKQAGEFTVSVPTEKPLKAELAFAGTKSGRDFNKFEGHGLTAAKAQKVGAPIVAECGLHIECRTVLVQDMTDEQMSKSIMQSCYPEKDYHTMFFGEIVACYRTDK